MATYFIGDIHGCYDNLITILDSVKFDPNSDILYLTGDLIARGPKSLEVLRLIKGLAKGAKTVLGNHDLYLLKLYFKKEKNKKNLDSSFKSIFQAPDLDELIFWLCGQSILHIDENKKILMVHAGIHPSWTIKQTILNAQEIEKFLTSKYIHLLFSDLNQFQFLKKLDIDFINKLKKIQQNINIFTKMRYVYLNGNLDFQYKDIPTHVPKNIYPWFKLSKFIIPNYSIVFGHWSSLKNTKIPNGFYGLDSGCCWGGDLSLLRWDDKKITKIPCSPPD